MQDQLNIQDDQKEKIRVNEEEYCKLNVVYTADTEDVQAKQEEAVVNLRFAKIPGFRKGKAPDYAIKSKLKNEISAWVLREMVDKAYEDVLFETKIKPIGPPEIKKIDMPDEKHFVCEMVVLKRPDVTLKEYKEIEVPKPPKIDKDLDKQVQITLDDLCQRFGDIQAFGDDDVVSDKDTVTLDYETSLNGEMLKAFSEEGALYTLGGPSKLPGMDEHLLGMKAGETKEFDLEVSEVVPEIGGKTVHVKTTIHMGTKPVPAKLDDELAKKLGVESIDEMKKSLEEILKQRLDNAEKDMIRRSVIEKLVDNNEVNIPSFLIDREAEHLAIQKKLDWSKISDEEKDVLRKNATDNVKLSLVLDQVRDTEPETVLSEPEAINMLKQKVAAQKVTDPEEFIVETRKNGRLFGLVAALKDEFTLQWLVDKAKVI